MLETFITIFCSVLASSGFWAFLSKRSEKKDIRTKLLVGITHDRILELGSKYIERGWITRDEYENLNDYLYTPYKELGGNGSAEKIMHDVDRLEVKSVDMILHEQEREEHEHEI